MKKFKERKITIHTDGSCTGNGTKNSYGSFGYVVLKEGFIIQEESQFHVGITSNQMEMLGVITALQWCFDNKFIEVQLFTDSQYVFKGCTEWMKQWKKNSWLTFINEPVKNKEYWKQIDYLINRIDVWFTWEKGHADNEWNNYVDMLCSSTVESNNGISFEK